MHLHPCDLSLPEAAAKLRDGSLSSLTLTEAHLDRIRERNEHYHAFTAVQEELALEQAARADAELASGVNNGPLHGIPVALKDLIDIEGIATTCGSRARDPIPAQRDAAVVERLRRAGAIIIGKLATYEFALVGPSFDALSPPSRNPWNVAHITGGSSSGCASAVAAGLVRTSLGTDTGGSLRSPAGYCGVVGLKPTFGRVSRRGVFPLSPSLDHVGPISASVAEAALTLDAIAGYDAADPGSLPERVGPAAQLLGREIAGLCIAYARDWFAADPELSPAVLSAMDDAASQLSLLGAKIEEVSLPDYAIFEAAGAVILHAEALQVHRELLRTRGGDYGRAALVSLTSGLCLTERDLQLAREIGLQLAETLRQDVFERCDALITVNTLAPALPLSAFEGERAVWTPMRTLPFNVTGHPALALPVGMAGGLPIGMQIVGKRNEEAQICRIGHAFENATEHSALRPPLIGTSMVESSDEAGLPRDPRPSSGAGLQSV